MINVVISFDFELGWGVADSSLWREREESGLYDKCQERLPKVINRMALGGMNSTWAFVTGLLKGEDDSIDLRHLRGDYRNALESFISEARPETREARGLVDQLASSGCFELATHSATHAWPDHPDIDENAWLSDVEISVHEFECYLGEKPRSIVFPRDQDDYLPSMTARLGLGGRLNPMFGRPVDLGSRLRRQLRALVAGPAFSDTFLSGEGCVFQTGSIYFNWFTTHASTLKRLQLEADLARLFSWIASGRHDGKTIHVWLHPFNLLQENAIMERFNRFLDQLERARDAGGVRLLTMAQWADEQWRASPIHGDRVK